MKKTVFLALAVFLLFLCSCRQQPEMTETLTGENTAGTTAEEKETKEKEPLETKTSESQTSDNKPQITQKQFDVSGVDGISTAFQEVLSGRSPFYSTLQKKTLYLSDASLFLFESSPYKIGQSGDEQFTLVDFNKDGVKELVIKSGHAEEESVLILQEGSDKVYGHLIFFSSMTELRTDGTFSWGDYKSRGTATVEFPYLEFGGYDTFLLKILDCIEETENGAKKYYIGQTQVTKKTYDLYAKKELAELAVWHPLAEKIPEKVQSSLPKITFDISEGNKVPEAYRSVLSGKEMFYVEYRGKNQYMYLADYTFVYSLVKAGDIDYLEFAVVDFDSDGNDEVVVSDGGDMLVLHEENGTVFGYSFSFRQMGKIYTDGSFPGYGSTSYGRQRILFFNHLFYRETSIETVERAENEGEADRCYIGGTLVNDETWKLYLEEQEKTEEVTWYPVKRVVAPTE